MAKGTDLMKNISIAAVIWLAAFVGVAGQGAKSVNDGIYTEAQATRGEDLFKNTCTTCHEKSRFIGDEFLSVWTEKPLHELFHHMSTTMPEDNPGTLQPQQYADVVAYFLKLNGYPAGKTELESGAEGLKTIKFDKIKKK
jgi:mono/diheme cytochrome c family protein